MITIQTPMPFCTITINATDHINNNMYNFSKVRQTSGTTGTISFQVNNTELPFDRLYTALLTLSNQESAQTVRTPIRLSKFLYIIILTNGPPQCYLIMCRYIQYSICITCT